MFDKIPTWLLVFGSQCPFVDEEETPDEKDAPGATYEDGPTGSVNVQSGGPGGRSTQGSSTLVTAGFASTVGGVTTCTRREVGESCVDISCVVSDFGESTKWSAGIIDVAGLLEPVQLVESQYEGIYGSFFVSGPSYYVPGADVTATASGDHVPQFTVTAPTPDQSLTVTDPPPPVGYTPETVPRDVDRHFAWDAPTVGKVTVELLVLTDQFGASRVIRCSQLGDPIVNEMVLPLSMLEDFDAVAATESILYGTDGTTMAGEFNITLGLGAPVLTPEGAPYGGRTLLFE